MRLPLELMQTFIAVAETLSFTHAGERVGRTQSAVSLQIKRLENEVGQALFIREGRGVSLSAKGSLLLPYARKMARLEQEALSVLSNPEMQGNVSLGIPEDYASSMLPKVLADFAATHPRVCVHMVSAPSDQLIVQLRRGELDLAVCNLPEYNSENGTSQDGEIIYQEAAVWVTSQHHDAHKRDPLPLAVFHHGCLFRRWAIQALERIGRSYRIAYITPSVGGILGAVRQGLAVAPIGRSTLGEGVTILDRSDGFPRLPVANVTLHRKVPAHPQGDKGQSAAPVQDALASHIIHAFR